MLSNRLSSITPSYTVAISSKVNELKNQGIDVINLSIGEPYFNIPNKAKEYGINSLNNNYTKYDLIPGLKDLRFEICNKLLNENNCIYSIDEIVVSSGAKHSITNTLLALTNPGDEVLLPKPYWVSYPESIKLVNAKPIFIDTKKDNNFKVTVNDLINYSTSKSKILILNNPSNPTGAIYTKNELKDIVDFCYKNNIYILADEIYERICFNNKFTSVASISDKAKEITITINGFSKSFAMTGIRLGYSASNKSIASAISSIQGHLTSHPSLVAQYIGLGALKYCTEDIDNNIKTYHLKRDLICKLIDNIPNIDYIYPEGAFYLFIDVSKLKSKIQYEKSYSIEFCNQLLENYNLAVVPGIAFGLDDYIRISFAGYKDEILEGVNRLSLFINDIF